MKLVRQVCWPVRYRSEQFVAEGTVSDVTAIGWRLSGTMPVVPGIELILDVSVPGQTEPLHIDKGIVLWVKGCEFALEAPALSAGDRALVKAALHRRPKSAVLPHGAGGGICHHQPLASRTVLSSQAPAATNPHPLRWSRYESENVQDGGAGHCMLIYEYDEDMARNASRQVLPGVWSPAARLLHGMLAMKQACALVGRNLILDN